MRPKPAGSMAAENFWRRAIGAVLEAEVTMGIAFVPRLSRPLGLLVLPALLVACSGGLIPPDDIDGADVGAIRPVQETIQPAAERQPLPRIDSDEAMAVGAPVQASMGVLSVPEGGVNMDEGLGVGRVEGLAEAQAEEIAEGGATQVVVDGIGTDAPHQLGAPVSIPMTAAAGEGVLRLPEKAGGEQVAFIPRLADPMQVPEGMGGMPASEKACRQRLRQLGVTFRDVPRVSRGKSCGIDWPVELSGLSGGIAVKPSAQVNCQITEAFARWVKSELVPATRLRYLSGVGAIHQMSSYSCRTMNSKPGNPMSEHAKGNAIDVGKIVLKNGKAITIEKKGFFAFREKGLLKSVRGDSCKYFSTVLGPGSDRYHKDHFHFDLRARKSGYRHCSL